MLKLIVGLGNPGAEYHNTRHNAGFWFVDELADKLAATWQLEGKFFAAVAKVRVASGECWLLKPQTFMNLSGKAVAALANFYKISPEQILVVHDELDFNPGVAKIKRGGGNGGHNGLKDIDRVLGNDYWRLRIGIGHPGAAAKVPGYVLKKPLADEESAILLSIERALNIMPLIFNNEISAAQKALHSN